MTANIYSLKMTVEHEQVHNNPYIFQKLLENIQSERLRHDVLTF